MKPENDENRITNVEVSTAISIGIKKIKVKIETKNTPPPIPAMVDIIPEATPKRTKRGIINDNSILNKREKNRKSFSKN